MKRRLLLSIVLLGAAARSVEALDREQFIAWGGETQATIDQTLGIAGSPLYAETAHADKSQSGGGGGLAFVWPLSTQFRVLNSLVQFDSRRYAKRLSEFTNQLNDSYWSPDGGYFCCIGGGDRFYDDNTHLAVALVEAYEVTGERFYLDRAKSVYDFLLTGEVPGTKGGSYWSVEDHTFLDTATALQGAKAAAMLYRATGDDTYLQNAVLRFNWARDNTQLPNGLYLEKVFLAGSKAGEVGNVDLVNFAGFGIGAATRLYDATGDLVYLREAQRIAGSSLRRYFDRTTGRINDEGYWAFELTDALVDLYERDNNQRWLDAVEGALTWLHENKRDPEGHYGPFWGRGGPQQGSLDEWSLNEQAATARAYLRLGLSKPLEKPDDSNEGGAVDAANYTLWRDARGADVILPNDRGAATAAVVRSRKTLSR